MCVKRVQQNQGNDTKAKTKQTVLNFVNKQEILIFLTLSDMALAGLELLMEVSPKLERRRALRQKNESLWVFFFFFFFFFFFLLLRC